MPSLSTIPARLPFVDCLAAGLLQETAAEPMALSAMTILLPTSRAQRSLREAFLRQSAGRPLLLPRLLALGDLDETEALFSAALQPSGAASTASALAVADILPAIPPLRRRLLLARLVLAKGDESGRRYTPDQAVRLAEDLARLLDQIQTEGLSLEGLPGLAPDRYARHWQMIVQFLTILTTFWPQMLAAEQCLDPADRRNRLLRAQAAIWREVPPTVPVIAAGITGSVPAAAELVAVVAQMPQGRVILPDLDLHLDEESWQALDESHPQHALRRLLQAVGQPRSAVEIWPVAARLSPTAPPLAAAERARLASEMMRPAVTTHLWRQIAAADLPPDCLRGLRRLDCPSQRDEALSIALMLREALETPERTAALVTPDRDLARRVAADLARWGIRVDDSAGRPLTVTPPGAFLRLTAAMVAEGFAPVPLLAVLKHPLAGAGLAPELFRDAVRRLEKLLLRGVRPGPGMEGLRMALAAVRHQQDEDRHAPLLTERDDRDLSLLLSALETCCQPLIDVMRQPFVAFDDLWEAHMRCAEALAAIDSLPGPLRLWAEDAGEVAAQWAREVGAAQSLVPQIVPTSYPPLLDALMSGQSVRQEFGSHPRVAILGPLEARLRHADLVVIGGLNDDVWPPRAPVDPWMSRPMRADFGLPQPEQRVGHAAHDFASLFCAPEVVLTRSRKVDGTPKVPSRWLLRLETVLAAVGLPSLGASPEALPWLDWSGQMDAPQEITRGQRPEPRPPVSYRPLRLSVTRIETWMRDPYAIYARSILRLQALAPLDDDPGVADYGTLVHKALELFQLRLGRGMPTEALALLLDCGREAFHQHIARPAVWAFWWPRFERLAAWVVEQERQRRPALRQTFTEVRGELAVGEGFTLYATADRLDLRHDGTLAVIDYKTGSAPSLKDVKAGFSPQLPLEALIARHGGFSAVGAHPVSELLYWELKGDEGGKERSATEKGITPDDLAQQALEGLLGLIAAFSRPETPYLSRPHPNKAPQWSDYQHLARVREWATSDADG